MSTKLYYPGKNIVAWRRAMHMSREHLACLANITPRELRQIEQGRGIRVEMLEGIALALGIMRHWLFLDQLQPEHGDVPKPPRNWVHAFRVRMVAHRDADGIERMHFFADHIALYGLRWGEREEWERMG